MPKRSSHILELARKGAQHRLDELKAEIASLVKTFPHLTGGGRHQGIDLSAEPAATVDPIRRKRRRRVSPAARRAVSLRMKKHWAARRKAKNA